MISVCFLIIFWCFRKFYSFRLSFSSFFQNFEFFVIFYRIQTGQKSLGIKKIWQPNQDRKILCWNSLWYPILKNKSSFIHFENLTNTCHLTCQVTGSKIPAFGPPRIFLHRECFAPCIINVFQLMCARSASSDLQRWLENFTFWVWFLMICCSFRLIFVIFQIF